MRVLAIEVCVSFEGDVSQDSRCGPRDQYVVLLAADTGESSAILARYVKVQDCYGKMCHEIKRQSLCELASRW